MDILEIEKINPWWYKKDWEDDKLIEVEKLPIKYEKKIEIKKGLNIIYGPRQVGKTTWIKQFIKKLNSKEILFLSCDGFFSPKELKDTLIELLKIKKFEYIFLDEITFIDNWEQVIKYLIDNFGIKDKFIIVTGSSSVNILNKKERLPGRIANIVPFYPLTFKEFVKLKNKNPSYEELFYLFRRFLVHGGYLKGINEFEMFGRVGENSLKDFSNGLDGELAIVKKDPRIFSYIISRIINSLTNTISWSGIAGSLISQPTVYDYIEIGRKLMFLDYIENKLAFHKSFVKNKKIYFSDPFHFWVGLFKIKKIKYVNLDSLLKYESKLVENFVFTEFLKRGKKVFYYKDRNKEVDFVVGNKEIEVKWSNSSKTKGFTLTKYEFDENRIPVYDYFFKL